jgi:hypothetical protein
VLRCDRQALQRVEGAIAKLLHHRNDQKSAAGSRRHRPEGKLESVGAHCFERLSKLKLERADIVSAH